MNRVVAVPFILFLLVSLSACASYQGGPDFIPANPEQIAEWQLEGDLEFKDKNTKNKKIYFNYVSIGEDYEFQIKDRPGGETVAVLNGVTDSNLLPEYTATSDSLDSVLPIETLRTSLPLEKMNYWLRALPVSGEAKITQKKNAPVSNIKESGWDIHFQDYMVLGNFLLPDKLKLQKDDSIIKMNIVRGDTGYLSGPCPDDLERPKQSFVNNAREEKVKKYSTVEELVPSDGSAPPPIWIEKTGFCQQLYKLHGKIPDPKIGLFGPKSVMWKLVSPYSVASTVPGPALTLQFYHPWLAKSVYDSSMVHDDFLERIQRTGIGFGAVIYGSMPQVMAIAHKMYNSHSQIEGTLNRDIGPYKKDSKYRATEVHAMLWILASFSDALVKSYKKYEGYLSDEEKEQFYEETKLFGMLMGIPETSFPKNWTEFVAYNDAMRKSSLTTYSYEGKALSDRILIAPNSWLIPAWWVLKNLTIADLPQEVRDDFDLEFGFFRRLTGAFMAGSITIASKIFPKFLSYNPLYHEANARLEGKRANWYHKWQIKFGLNVDGLVN